MDISLCALDLENKKLVWAGANNPLWIIRDGLLLETKPNKQPIGRFTEPRPFTSHSIQLNANDTLYIFTDGFADQFGGNDGKKFMYKNLRRLLIEVSALAIDEQKTKLKATLDSWKGMHDQVDDVCIIGVKIS
jgi:serine phosphatase RsbU (regulator of sigma subunit)